MDNRGFTLVELIATIALLAIISVISYVSITKIVEQGQKNDCEILVKNIKSAANEYVSDNRYKNSFASGVDDYNISINALVLIDGNYLSSPIVNPFDKTEIEPSSITINIKLNSDYTSKEVTITSPAVLQNCND